MKTVELKPERPLYELLVLDASADGVNEVRRLASLGVQGVDAEGASLLGRTVAEWATADLAQELEKAFRPDPFTLMAQAWGQVRKVHKAVGASRGPPPVVQTIGLLKHELDASLAPRLVLNVDGVDWCDIKLELGLKLSFESVQIELLDGRLTALKLGNPGGSITLKCQGQEVAAFKRDIKLDKAYRFEPPLAWPGSAHA